jgi:6-phosphofructokinase 2
MMREEEINVSKAISRLEGTSAVFASGGPSGEMIKEILNKGIDFISSH